MHCLERFACSPKLINSVRPIGGAGQELVRLAKGKINFN